MCLEHAQSCCSVKLILGSSMHNRRLVLSWQWRGLCMRYKHRGSPCCHLVKSIDNPRSKCGHRLGLVRKFPCRSLYRNYNVPRLLHILNRVESFVSTAQHILSGVPVARGLVIQPSTQELPRLSELAMAKGNDEKGTQGYMKPFTRQAYRHIL